MTLHPSSIHPTAIVGEGADIGAGVRIGPYCVVGSEVVLGEGVVLHSHVAVAGVTRIGAGTQIFPFASIGHAPQDLKYAGERTELVIGANNRIREHVTMNPGTQGGGGVTRVGDGNLFMMSVHIGHDCQVGSGVIMANNATLAGHVVVEDNVILGGLAAVHQFVRIGRGAMIGGLAGVVADVIPYGSVIGERAHLAGLNLVGLKRRGAERAEIHGLRAAFGEIFAAEGTLQDRVDAAAAKHAGNALVEEVLRFITAESSRSFTVPA
ncbi:MAG: acyl-[acyl-carrier-protein]--UDP-N-acetylglucosamine O-acyltransferase [Rhodovulum sulfidophilum]|uniref:Acyl-[acyl-carrier-protein]--UDP-N-acetylglucosamine O-acyltransferase n=1 Tax=Rhodovulum sulfidophilum TaxID=35806 RepID=A0A2W5N8N0_RHOSU|nr:MAG: acyl-[acyl-carrier-protein]--UDP-N-acetylglucosamine O-acyltransferase [Rhodovulum sulfidophilum]